MRFFLKWFKVCGSNLVCLSLGVFCIHIYLSLSKDLWWFLIHFLWPFVLDSKIYWLWWSWNGILNFVKIGLTCWFWALKFMTQISSFSNLKKSFIQSVFSPICMSDEMTNKFDWSVDQENVQTCAGYCSTNLRLKYLLRWIGYEN